MAEGMNKCCNKYNKNCVRTWFTITNGVKAFINYANIACFSWNTGNLICSGNFAWY